MPGKNVPIGLPKIYLIIELWYDSPNGYKNELYEVFGRGPIGAATFREMAEMICQEKTLAFLRSDDFDGFGPYADSPESKEEQTTLFKFGLKKDLEFKKNYKPSDDDLLAICDFFDLQFFVVKEVDLFA